MQAAPASHRLAAIALLCAGLCPIAGGCATSVCKDDWFGPDKPKHFAAGFAIGAATTSLARLDGARPQSGAAAGLGATAAAGIAKEAYDLKGQGTCWSWKDLAWDLLGGAAGVGVGAAIDASR